MNQHNFFKLSGLIASISLLITLTVVGGLVLWMKNSPAFLAQLTASAASQGIDNSASNMTSAALHPAETVVVEAVKKADPAVVAITISKNVPVFERYYENIPNPYEEYFGGDFYLRIPEVRQKGTEKKEIGGGSGFLVSPDGYIVTNRHVVSDENAEYTVFTTDGKKYHARVIARDPVLDLAVIKIDGTNFPYLQFGNSDALKVGQSVVAIGNALAEFRNTVSIGIVSGLSRSIVAASSRGSAESLDELIQTDAAINQGNSGGPLLNLSGEVIGMNVAVASGAENIGFALSSNSIKNIVESVKKTGKIIRPYLGVRYVPVSEEIKNQHKLSVDYGVLVISGDNPNEHAVIPGSAADKAGIVEDDIILEVDGTKITSSHTLGGIIRAKKVGDTVQIKILHSGKEKTLTAVLQEMK